MRQQKCRAKFFNPLLKFDPDCESSTSLIDAAFIKLTSDNDKRTERIEKIKFAPTKSQGKKKEQCQKEKERRRADRRKMSNIKECRRMGRSLLLGSTLVANINTLARLTHPRRLLKRTIVLPSKQDVQHLF